MDISILIIMLFIILLLTWTVISVSVAQKLLMSQVLAGNAVKGYNGEGLPATSSLLRSPYNTWGDTNGVIYIADRTRIRKVVNGTMTTLIGTQYTTFNGDGLPGTSTNLVLVTSVWGDSMGSFLYFSDVSIQKIRRYSFSTGIVSNIIGSGGTGLGAENITGTSSLMNGPYFIYGDSIGNIFLSDQANNRIRRYSMITTRIVTIVGFGGPGFNVDNATGTSVRLYYPAGLWGDSDGNIIFSDRFNYRIRKWTRSTQIVVTVAGTGTAGYSGDGGPATLAQNFGPLGVYVDQSGIIYFFDGGTQRIRSIINGIINTLSGGGAGSTGDGGPATSAGLNGNGVWANSNGQLFCSDLGNYKVRSISGGIINRFAGTGYLSYGGDGGPANLAFIDSPGDIWGDSNGNLYIADINNYRIRMINSSNIITTFGGNGINSWTASGSPFLQTGIGAITSIYGDSTGGFYYSANNIVRKATSSTSIVTSLAGEGSTAETGFNVSAKGARFNVARGLFVDTLGNVYIADYGKHFIRLYVKKTQRVLIFAGNGTAGFSGNGGLATAAKLNFPYDTWGDTNGVLYIIDQSNNRIRRVDSSNIITTFAGTGIRSSGLLDDVPATSANLNVPYSIYGDALGNIYIAEYYAARIRMIYTDSVSGNSLIRSLFGTGSSATDTGKILASTDALGVINAVWVDSLTQIIYFVESTSNFVRQSFSVSLPTSQPTTQPSAQPSRQPISCPTSQPTVQPSETPTSRPTNQPTSRPILQPSNIPTTFPSNQPSSQPTLIPSSSPSALPSSDPSVSPSVRPNSCPTTLPSARPTHVPHNCPTITPSISTNTPTTDLVSTKSPTASPSQLSLGSLPRNLSIIFNGDQIVSLFIDPNNIKIVLLLISPQPSLPLNELFRDIVISSSALSSGLGASSIILGDATLPSLITLPTGSTVFDDDYENRVTSNIVHSFSYGVISDQIGRSLASVGDVNKDGVTDILLGDFRSSKVYVFFGNRSPLSRWKDMNQGYTVLSSTRGDSFGWAVSGISDFNADGIDDWMSCAIITNRCYIIYGREIGNQDISVQQLTKTIGFTITTGGGKVTALGMAIAGGGDMNGDGLNDVIISAISITGDNMNIVYIVYGGGQRLADHGTLNLDNMILGVDGMKIVAPSLSFAAMSISLVGDINGDEIADLAIGSIPYDQGQYVSQVSYIVYGKDNSSQPLILSNLQPSEGTRINGGGFIVTGISDVNEDGYNDVMVVSYDSWRGQRGGYIVLTPKKGLITSAPTVRPSLKPSTTFQPSLTPTIVTTPQLTSLQPYLSNTSTFPTNIGLLTSCPSHNPTTSTPSLVPTRNPSLSPTIRQSKLKTVAPTASSLPSLSPSYRRTSLPSQVPTTRPTKTIAPSYTITRAPSTVPTLPLPPSVIVSSLSSNITTITEGGVYSTSSQSKCCSSCAFLISTSDDVTITPQGNDGCKHHYYKILPLTTTATITSLIARQGSLVIKPFNIQTDIIDLTAFTYLRNLTEVSYSNNPVILLLSSSSSSSDITQRVMLPSLSSFDSLTASNFIFTASSNEEGRTSFQLFTRSLIIAFAVFAALIVFTILYAFRDRITLKTRDRIYRNRQSNYNNTNISLSHEVPYVYKENTLNKEINVINDDTHYSHDLQKGDLNVEPTHVMEVKERRSHRCSSHERSINNNDVDDNVDSDSSAYDVSNRSDDFDSFSDDNNFEYFNNFIIL